MTTNDGQPELFRPTWSQTWRTNLRPWLPADVLILVFGWAGIYGLTGSAFAFVPPLAVIALIVAAHRWASRSQRLRVSDQGIEFFRRDGGVARMRWPDIQGVAILTQRRGGVIAPYGVGRAAAASSMSAFVAANTGPGLLGLGETLTAAEAAQQRRHGLDWLAFRQAPSQCGMRLTVIDREWQRGPIGEWVRRYRPDLLPPVPPVPSPAPRS